MQKIRVTVLILLSFALQAGCNKQKQEKNEGLLNVSFSVDDWKSKTNQFKNEAWMEELKEMLLVNPKNLPARLPSPKDSNNVKIVINKTPKGERYYVMEWFCSSYSDVVKGYIPLLTMRGWMVKEHREVTPKKNIFLLRRKREGITLVFSKMPSGYFWRVRLSMFPFPEKRR